MQCTGNKQLNKKQKTKVRSSSTAQSTHGWYTHHTQKQRRTSGIGLGSSWPLALSFAQARRISFNASFDKRSSPVAYNMLVSSAAIQEGRGKSPLGIELNHAHLSSTLISGVAYDDDKICTYFNKILMFPNITTSRINEYLQCKDCKIFQEVSEILNRTSKQTRQRSRFRLCRICKY